METAPETNGNNEADASRAGLSGRYIIESPAFPGGRGEVRKGRDKLTGNVVALKTLPPGGVGDNSEIDSLKREYLLLLSIGHPLFPDVYDFGFHGNDCPFYTMEWIEGEPITAIVSREERRTAPYLLIPVLHTLDFLHRKNLVFVDVKPDHIRVGGARSFAGNEERAQAGNHGGQRTPTVRMIDPGLSTNSGSAAGSGITGTFPYISPEMLQGRSVDGRADLFSVGVLLLELLTGRPPFLGNTIEDTARNIILEDPLKDLDLPFPEGGILGRILAKLLEKDPSRRYGTAAKAAFELEQLAASAGFAVPGIPPPGFPEPFTGREQALSTCLYEGRRAAAGRGGMVRVTGVEGTGKSRFLGEAAGRLGTGGFFVLRMECREREDTLSQLITMVEALFPRDLDVETMSTLLEEENKSADVPGETALNFLAGVLQGEGEMRFRTRFQQARELIARLATASPLALVIDKIEVADQGFHRFLQFLAGGIMDVPVLLLLGGRGFEIEAPGMETLTLENFEPDRTEAFISAVLGAGRGIEKIADMFHDSTGGNPRFLRELLAWIQLSGLVEKEPGGRFILKMDREGGATPGSLRELLLPRFDALLKEDFVILTKAAFLQAPFDGSVLSGLADGGMGAGGAAVARLVSGGCLKPARGEKFELSSGLARDILREGVSEAEKRGINLEIARSLEKEPAGGTTVHAGSLAYHYLQAARPLDALPHALEAAETAERDEAFELAAGFYSRALEAIDAHASFPAESTERESIHTGAGRPSSFDDHPPGNRVALRARVLSGLAANMSLQGNHIESVRLFAELLESGAGNALPEAETAAARRNYALVLAISGLDGRNKPEDLLRENLASAGNDPDERYYSTFALLKILDLRGDYGRAVEIAKELRASMAIAGDELRLAELDNYTGILAAATGRYREARRACVSSLAIRIKLGTRKTIAKSWNNLGILEWREKKMKKAEKYYGIALKIWEETDDTTGAADTLNNLGVLFSGTGNTEEAIECFERSLAHKKLLGDYRGAATAINNVAILRYRRGEMDLAADLYREAEEIRRRIDDRDGLSKTLNNLGLLYAQREDWPDAAASYTESITIKKETGDRHGMASTLGNLGMVYFHTGEWEKAEALFRESRETAAKLEDEALGINAEECLAILATARGELDQARASLEAVLTFRRKEEDRKLLADTLASLGELHREAGMMDEAETFYREARETTGQTADRARTAKILAGLAELHLGKGALAGALEEYNEAALLAGGAGGSGGSGGALLGGALSRLEGLIMRRKGEKLRAEKAFERSIEILEARGYRFDSAKSMRELGLLLLGNGDRRGVGFLEKAQKIFSLLPSRQWVDKTRINLEQYDSEEAPSIDSDVISRIAGLFSTGMGIDRILAETMEMIIEKVNAERGLLLLLDRSTGDFEVKVDSNIDGDTISDARAISRNIISRVYHEDEVLFSSNAREDERFSSFQSIVDHRILSFICVPMRSRGRILGTIYVDNRSFLNPLKQADASLMNTFANIAGVALENAILRDEIRKRNVYLQREVERRYSYGNIVGKSNRMAAIFDLIEKIKDVKTSILIEGETGTGKELVARAIHFNGSRKDRPFVTVDCGVLHENLMESELFGHMKGAFSGAYADKKGLVELAAGGTLFLDEIGNLGLGLQAKLLRVIQDGSYRRLGGERALKADLRLVCATNSDLESMVAQGGFREDLYYRINVVSIRVPALRERNEDIPVLADHILENKAGEVDKKLTGFDSAVLEAMMEYHWPGNVREMENMIERMVILASTTVIGPELLPENLSDAAPADPILSRTGRIHDLQTMEKMTVLAALEKAGWHQSNAAKLLGVSERTLRYKMKKFNILNIKKEKRKAPNSR